MLMAHIQFRLFGQQFGHYQNKNNRIKIIVISIFGRYKKDHNTEILNKFQ